MCLPQNSNDSARVDVGEELHVLHNANNGVPETYLTPFPTAKSLENEDDAIFIPIASTSQGSHNESNYAPLRLTGGGDTSFAKRM